MSSPDPSEVMAVVARRGDVLRALDAGGVGKRDIDDRLDVSRSTIDRSIRELEATGFVERTAGGYRRTLAGRLALEEYDAFESRIGGVVESLDALSTLPADARLDASLFDDARVVFAERHSPHQPVTALCDHLGGVSAVHGFSPTVLPQFVDTLRETIVSCGTTAKLAVTEPVVERLVSAYSDDLQVAAETGNLTVRSLARELVYGLYVAETDDGPETGLLILGESGPRAFVANDDPDAVEWARARVNEVWQTGDPLPVGPGDS